MKKYSKPEVEVCFEELEEVLMASGISKSESILGFKGDETW